MSDFFPFLGFVILIWAFYKIRDESTNNNPYKVLDYNCEGNFIEKKKKFYEILKLINTDKTFQTFKAKRNFKDLFDSIYLIKFEDSPLTFKEYNNLFLEIQYFVDHFDEIMKEQIYSYRGRETTLGIYTVKIEKVIDIYYPIIKSVDLDEYFSFLETNLKNFSPIDVAEKIGFINTYNIYFLFKNIKYLYEREDITLVQLNKLNDMLSNKIMKRIST